MIKEAIKMLKEVLRRNLNKAVACLYLSDIQMHQNNNNPDPVHTA